MSLEYLGARPAAGTIELQTATSMDVTAPPTAATAGVLQVPNEDSVAERKVGAERDCGEATTAPIGSARGPDQAAKTAKFAANGSEAESQSPGREQPERDVSTVAGTANVVSGTAAVATAVSVENSADSATDSAAGSPLAGVIQTASAAEPTPLSKSELERPTHSTIRGVLQSAHTKAERGVSKRKAGASNERRKAEEPRRTIPHHRIELYQRAREAEQHAPQNPAEKRKVPPRSRPGEIGGVSPFGRRLLKVPEPLLGTEWSRAKNLHAYYILAGAYGDPRFYCSRMFQKGHPIGIPHWRGGQRPKKAVARGGKPKSSLVIEKKLLDRLIAKEAAKIQAAEKLALTRFEARRKAERGAERGAVHESQGMAVQEDKRAKQYSDACAAAVAERSETGEHRDLHETECDRPRQEALNGMISAETGRNEDGGEVEVPTTLDSSAKPENSED